MSQKTGGKHFKCYVTYHPLSVVQGGFQFEERIVEDLRRLKKGSLKPPRVGLPGKNNRIVGFDTEFDRAGALLTVGLASSDAATALETTEKDWLKKTRKVIHVAKGIVGHSIAGDLDYLVRLGLAKDKWLAGIGIRDSFLLARMHDENRGKGGYGLEALLLSEFNFAPWKADTEALIKKTGNAADWSVEQRTARCRLDAWATRILAERFERKLKNVDLRE